MQKPIRYRRRYLLADHLPILHMPKFHTPPIATGTSSLQPAPASACTEQRGMALVIVVIVFFILSIVVMQLQFTGKIEKRVIDTRAGQAELDLALESCARGAIMKLRNDWEEDQNDEGDPQDPNNDPNPPDPPQDPPPSPNEPPDPPDPDTPQPAKGTDSRHEAWAHPYNERINDAEIKTRISDGESRIDLNFLFKYAVPKPPEDTEPEAPPDPNDPPPDPANPPPDPNLPPNPDDDPDPDADADASEWKPPTPEEEEATRLMLTRLIQSIIDYNKENDFEYDNTPNPAAAANQIVAFVIERQRDPLTRVFRGLGELQRLDEIPSELWFGPKDPREEEDEEDEDENGEEDDRTEAPDILREFLEGQLPFDLDLSDLAQLEDGVAELPKPLALRDFFATTSNGKLNLNTMRREMMVALLVSIEDLVQATEIATQLDDHLNSYKEEEDPTGAGVPAGTPSTPLPGEEDPQPQEFSVFRSLSDLDKVNEEWDDELPGQDDSVLELIKKDFKNVVFQSQNFIIHMDAERKGRTLSADLTVHRDSQKAKIRVLQWKALNR